MKVTKTELQLQHGAVRGIPQAVIASVAWAAFVVYNQTYQSKIGNSVGAKRAFL